MQNSFYDIYAHKFAVSTINVDVSDLRKRFLHFIRPGGRILDAGCGSGRDGRAFKKAGYTVTAFDASEKMVEIASLTLGQPVMKMTFQEIDFREEFDGIWACASLLHVPKMELPKVFKLLSNSLVTKGVLYISFKYGDQERVKSDGRYFVDMDEHSLLKILDNVPSFRAVNIWLTNDHRPERSNEIWLNGILQKNINL